MDRGFLWQSIRDRQAHALSLPAPQQRAWNSVVKAPDRRSWLIIADKSR
jgi:hypothetical protein